MAIYTKSITNKKTVHTTGSRENKSNGATNKPGPGRASRDIHTTRGSHTRNTQNQDPTTREQEAIRTQQSQRTREKEAIRTRQRKTSKSRTRQRNTYHKRKGKNIE
jgi:hypothetical protein